MLDITNCEQLWGDYEGSELKFAIEKPFRNTL